MAARRTGGYERRQAACERSGIYVPDSYPAWIQPADYVAMLTERGRGWVAEAESRIMGFAVADRRRMNVWALFVDPSAEGRGVGRRLHDAMMEWLFTAAGAERVWLSTDPGTRAERFYQAAGWCYAGPEPNGEARYELAREQWMG